MFLYFTYNSQSFEVLNIFVTEDELFHHLDNFRYHPDDNMNWIALNISDAIKSNVMFKSFTEQVDKEKFAKLLKKVGKLK